MSRALKASPQPRLRPVSGRAQGAPSPRAIASGIAQTCPPLPEPPPAGPFALDRHVFYWITLVIGRRDRQLSGRLRPHGLRVPEWRVLAYLYSLPNSPMGDVAEAAALDHTTLSRTVDRLEVSGLLARQPDAADLRVTRLALTAKGQARFADVWPVVDEMNRAAVALLPEGAVDLLCLALRKMREGLDCSLAPELLRAAAASRPATRIVAQSKLEEEDR